MSRELQTLLPETATLYPKTGDFVAETETATKYPVSGYKVSCFGNQRGQAFSLPLIIEATINHRQPWRRSQKISCRPTGDNAGEEVVSEYTENRMTM